MGKISVIELAAVLSKRYGLNKKDATAFVTKMFDIIQQSLEQEQMVKVKGLGTFKIIDVDARESVNVNTGERVLIEGHNKMTFTPDPLMKELVNKPFSQFETVVLNDGVDFEDAQNEAPVAEPEPEVVAPTPEPEEITEPEEMPLIEVETESEESSVMPLVDFGEKEDEIIQTEEETQPEEEEDDEDIPEWVIEPYVPKAEAAEEPVAEEPAPVEEPVPVEEAADDEFVPEGEPLMEEAPVEAPVEETPEAEPEPEAEAEPEKEAEAEEEPEAEYVFDDEEESSGKKWLWALLALIVGLAGGYLLGNYYPMSNFPKPAAVDSVLVESVAADSVLAEVEPVDSVVAEDIEKAEQKTEEVKAEEPKAEEPKAEPAKVEQPKAEAPKAAEPEKKAEEQLDQYQKKDSRVRTGAWRIVGTAQVYKVKEGETLVTISRRFLGKDMECYIEVYNNLTADSPLKAGQEIKIPQLKHKNAK